MQASFWTIYKRGRFSERGLSDEEKMKQRERFGVACLALCLHHDKSFRTEFLRSICHIHRVSEKWNVEVDPYRNRSAAWADLLLTGKNCAIVVECKVDDRLVASQDPWKKDNSFMEESKGYGWFFRNEFTDSDRTYITLTRSRVDPAKPVAGTRCRSATWSNVKDLSIAHSPWVKDLYASLANLDYPAFRFMKIENARVNDVKSVISCHEILAVVAERLGLADWKIEHKAESEGATKDVSGGYLGVEIRRFRNARRDADSIRKLIGSPWEEGEVAWYGYELTSAQDKQGLLSVWFYSGGEQQAEVIKERIRHAPKWQLLSKQEAAKKPEKHFLRLMVSTSKETSDVEQFLSLLTRVIPELKR